MSRRRRRSRRRPDGGFTLLETLAMLVVVGFLVAGLAAGTEAGLKSWATQTRWSRDGDDAGSAERVLRGLIVGMNGGDVFAGTLSVSGGAHTLSFTTALPAMPPGERTTEAHVAIGVEGGDLVLHWTPALPNRFGGAVTRTAILLPAVASVEFGYWHGGGWQPAWHGDGVPSLVRVRVSRAGGGEGGVLPDIVAAPFRTLLAPPG